MWDLQRRKQVPDYGNGKLQPQGCLDAQQKIGPQQCEEELPVVLAAGVARGSQVNRISARSRRQARMPIQRGKVKPISPAWVMKKHSTVGSTR